MKMRKLASVQYIHHITPIKDADRIECIHVLGWQCVAKRGEFREGELCVYMEVDAFLPIREEFEFLRGRSYRKSEILGEGFLLKSQNIRGVVSQGLVLPLSILPAGAYQPGDDVTEILGIKKWEVEEKVTSSGTVIGELPAGIPKTDELRVQSHPELIDEMKKVDGYYISTKMDGTSVTMYRKGGFFGVCGRNYEYADDGKCAMWKYAHQCGIEEKMKDAGLDDIAMQGEFCGAGIQKNRLKLIRPEWYVFTVIDLKTGRRYSLQRLQQVCKTLRLKTVPIEECGDRFPYEGVEALLERARGKYPSGMNKEGIVIRPMEPVYSKVTEGPLSMKVLNNDFLLGE